MVIVSDLCLTCAMLSQYLFIMVLVCRQLPMAQYLIIFDQKDGQAVGSPFNFVSLLKAFPRIFPMGGWGWS